MWFRKGELNINAVTREWNASEKEMCLKSYM